MSVPYIGSNIHPDTDTNMQAFSFANTRRAINGPCRIT